MLASRGLKDSPLFTVAEGKVDEDGLLPQHHVEQVRSWLEMLAEDAEARTAVVRQTLDGAVRDLSHHVYPVADGLAAQQEAAAGLRDAVGEVYDAVASGLGAAATDGTLHRGELAARWREFVGTGELARSLDTRVSGIRDRLVNAIKGKPQQAERVRERRRRPSARWCSSTPRRPPRGPRPPGRSDPPARSCWPAAPTTSGAPRATSAAAPSRPSRCGRRTSSSWCAAPAPTSARPRGSWRSASTGSRWR